MKQYGTEPTDNLHCPYGCCTTERCSNKYRREHAANSEASDKAFKKKARRENKKEIEKEINEIVQLDK